MKWCLRLVLSSIFFLTIRCFQAPSPESLSYFSFQGQTFRARPCRIYDGDTFTAIFQYRGEWIKWRCRCLDYDSPEIRPRLTMSDRQQEIELAILARNRLEQLLTRTDSVQIECGGFDKYGRILVTVYSYYPNNKNDRTTEKSMNTIMLEEGHGVPFP